MRTLARENRKLSSLAAPTRLRLLLWSLTEGHDEFSTAPPPGLVTIPVVDVPDGCYTMSGYRRAGTRAIRIDMLWRQTEHPKPNAGDPNNRSTTFSRACGESSDTNS